MSLKFLTEQELVDQLSQSSTEAFEELYKRYWFSLYTYCHDKLKSSADAKTVVSSIFISLWEKRSQLPVNFSMSAHLYTEVRAAVVKCINEKLSTEQDVDAIEKEIIPGFTVEQLKKAYERATPKQEKEKETYVPLPIPVQQKEPWWPAHMNFKNLKYAFQRVMHLF